MFSNYLSLSGAKCLVGLAFALSPQFLLADSFTQTNLVSDVPGMAQNTDPNLKNPWGVSFAVTSPFWVSDQASGMSTLYGGTGSKVPLNVPIPGGNPTGQVFAFGSGFDLPNGKPAFFIFDTLNGTIDGWGGPGTQTQLAGAPTGGAIYTGLTLASSGGTNYLYAADATGQIRVFNSSYKQVALSGNFTDPNAVAGFVPFNIELIGKDLLYVTYAKLTSVGTGLPGGYVDVFNTNGTFVKRLATNGQLNAPWGLALAPSGFGSFGRDLLVGNFGNTGSGAGEINAYNPSTGAWVGTLDGPNGKPLVNDFLWSLEFRTGGPDVNTDALYFTAGINNQKDGLFGEIATPEPGMAIPVFIGLAGLGFLKLRRRQSLR